MDTSKSISTIQFDGGCLCFDFINTVQSRLDDSSLEYLKEYNDVLLLSERQEIISAQVQKELANYANTQPERAKKVLAELLAIRENMYQLFSAIAAGKKVAPNVLQTFNTDLAKANSHLYFDYHNNLLELLWKIEPTDLYLPVRMALKSAYDILTKEEFKRIKECGACGWLFLDKSKNNTRRWCDMQVCGSNDKAKRYYHRKKHSLAHKHE